MIHLTAVYILLTVLVTGHLIAAAYRHNIRNELDRCEERLTELEGKVLGPKPVEE